MRRRNADRWTPMRLPLAVKVNAWQAWGVIFGAAGTIAVFLYFVYRAAAA